MDNNQFLIGLAKIISAQSEVIGPVAYDLAQNVPGLQFSDRKIISSVHGDQRNILSALVKQYSSLFGQSSVEICKDAIHSINPPLDESLLPEELTFSN